MTLTVKHTAGLAVLSMVTVSALAATPGRAQSPVATATREMRSCAALGPKPPGAPSTIAYAKYLRDRFVGAGLQTRYETFHLPRYTVQVESIRVVGMGARVVPGEAFAYSGTGTVQGDVVDVGDGRPHDFIGKDVKGKIVMVKRNVAYHRIAQLTEIISRGGAAMLYVSDVVDNLVQTGTVRFAQDFPSPIPAMTVGADDGAALRKQLASSGLRMRLRVDATRTDAIGRNVIGVRLGKVYPDKYIVVGGHYDNWHAGAVDNCSSMGSMLQIVDETKDLDPAYTVIFAAWDAEEVGLTGSYDFVRRHPDIVKNTVVNENLEMTSAATYVNGEQQDNSLINLIFGTTNPTMNAIAYEAATRVGFTPLPTTANSIRAISGGIIPTDLQPFYARGVQGFSTFSLSPYYHTRAESPEKIHAPSHVRVTDYLKNVLTDLQAVPPQALQLREIPDVTIEAPATAPAGDAFTATVSVVDPAGQPVDDVDVRVLVNQNDHWAVASGLAKPLGGGRYAYVVPSGATKADTTWLTATVNETLYQASGFARVDQRATAPSAGAGAPATVDTDSRSSAQSAQAALPATGLKQGPMLASLLGALLFAGLLARVRRA